MTVNNGINPKRSLLIAIITLILLQLCINKCHAQQLDTLVCKPECIAKFVSIDSTKRVYAVYNDYDNDISELIFVPKQVYRYIKLCYANCMTPSLGIKLRNRQIICIIQYRHKMIKPWR